MVESKIVIVPLTGANFPPWKIQCKMSLIKDGLWGIVDGNEAAPAETDGAYSKYISRKNRALAIVLPIDPSLLYLLGDPVTQKLVRRTGFGNQKWSGRTNLCRPNLVRPD